MARTPTTIVLLCAADPSDQAGLRLDDEVSKVRRCWQESNHRERVAVEAHRSTTARDLRNQILNHRPSVVHFSGHGAGRDGLVLQDDDGASRLVAGDALADLFGLFRDTVKCVVLNCCFSKLQAEEIVKSIPCVIGMSSEIGDDAAIDFAIGFYDALFSGEPVARAFAFGCNSIRLESLPAALQRPVGNRDISAAGVVAAEVLPEHLKPVLLGDGDLRLIAVHGSGMRWWTKLALAAVATVGVGALAMKIVEPSPDPPPKLEDVAEALRNAYVHIAERTASATLPRDYRQRLQAAVFEEIPACHGRPQLLLDAVQQLIRENFFALHQHDHADEDLDVLRDAGLRLLLQQRLSWLESDVLPALDKTHPVELVVPVELPAPAGLQGPVLSEHFAGTADVHRQISELQQALDQTATSDAQ